MKWASLSSVCFSVALLLGCGGGGGSSNPAPTPTPNPTPTGFSIGGTITGSAQAIALSLNGNAESFVGANFTFSARLNDGDDYEVLFVSSGGANESCTLVNGNGVIAGADVTNIEVTCEQVSDMSILQYNNTAILGGLASGDFNGDGNADLGFLMRTLDGHPLGNNLYFVRFAFGNGAGSFANVLDVASECDRVLKRGYTVMAADFNADGFDDLVCRGGDTGLEVMNGGLTPATVFTTATFQHGSGYFRAVDFNADGLPDIFDLGDGQGSPVVEPNFEYFINDGTDDFGTIQSFAILNDIQASLGGLAYGAAMFVVGDVNGDGRDDLITMGKLRQPLGEPLHIVVFTGIASGGFNLPTSATIVNDIDGAFIVGEEFRDLTSGDFNADGNLDLAISHGAEFVQILLGDGLGGFTDQGPITVGRLPVHIASADFNGDGALDLVTLNEDSHTLHISYGFGDGTFGSAATGVDDFLSIPLDNEVNLYDMLIADFDGNGVSDIAFAESALQVSGPVAGNGSVQIFLNPGQ